MRSILIRLLPVMFLAGGLYIAFCQYNPPSSSPDDNTDYDSGEEVCLSTCGDFVPEPDGWEYNDLQGIGYNYDSSTSVIDGGTVDEAAAAYGDYTDCEGAPQLGDYWYAADPAWQTPAWDSIDAQYTISWQLYSASASLASCDDEDHPTWQYVSTAGDNSAGYQSLIFTPATSGTDEGDNCPDECDGLDLRRRDTLGHRVPSGLHTTDSRPLHPEYQEPCACDSDCSGSDFCDPDSCTCSNGGENDIIVIGLGGAAVNLTGPDNGIRFNMAGTGKQQMSWTASGWNGGFLVLDRSGKGEIDNGSEMFTPSANASPVQPFINTASPIRSPAALTAAQKHRSNISGSFATLAAFDQPSNGGNNDGILDRRDAVYAQLRVWVDTNHNGVSDPGELVTLSALGISTLSLTPEASRWNDSVGNKFIGRTQITRNGVPQWIYDVRLKVIR